MIERIMRHKSAHYDFSSLSSSNCNGMREEKTLDGNRQRLGYTFIIEADFIKCHLPSHISDSLLHFSVARELSEMTLSTIRLPALRCS